MHCLCHQSSPPTVDGGGGGRWGCPSEGARWTSWGVETGQASGRGDGVVLASLAGLGPSTYASLFSTSSTASPGGGRAHEVYGVCSGAMADPTVQRWLGAIGLHVSVGKVCIRV